MESSEAAALLLVAVLFILILLFITAKGEKRKITVISDDGSRIAVDAEIADSPATRAKGLMGRESLGENEGMLFVFGKPGTYAFWMLNTSMPLDAIHFSGNGTVVDIIRMEPCGLNVACPRYPPKEPSMYVLEVNQGFARGKNISIGKSRLVLPVGS
jgi:uncharacterized membrane protein (UPF0127 family)